MTTTTAAKTTLVLHNGVRIPLEAHTDDTRSKHHVPVLLIPMWSEHPATVYDGGLRPIGDVMGTDQDIVDGQTFRLLRDLCGVRIETTDVAAVCRSLGMPQGEPGIVTL